MKAIFEWLWQQALEWVGVPLLLQFVLAKFGEHKTQAITK